MSDKATQFRKKFLFQIALALTIPAVFGLGFLGYIEIFTVDQLTTILTTPLMPAFVLASLFFSLVYFDRFSHPLVAYVADADSIDAGLVEQRLRRFPVVFWLLFLGYLMVAPAVTIACAEIYADFTARPVDWFRVHLVALIVSIIVGLPIFFTIFDLFGKYLGKLELARPVLTIKTRVFLIGALVPLLIDTMLVQYFWTRTGFFNRETFIIWLLLEILAVAGALMFVRSFGQSLSPLQLLNPTNKNSTPVLVPDMVPSSTDELGLLTRELQRHIEQQQLHQVRLSSSNELLRATQKQQSLQSLLRSFVDTIARDPAVDHAMLLLADAKRGQLVCVAQSGSQREPGDEQMIPLDEDSYPALVFRGAQQQLPDNEQISAIAGHPLFTGLTISAVLCVPLQVGGEKHGLLLAGRADPSAYDANELAMLELHAREMALAYAHYQDQQNRLDTESAIRQITEGVSTAVGEQFFAAITNSLGKILGADYVGIGVPDDEGTTIRTLAVSIHGRADANAHYRLTGTPCEQVFGKQAVTIQHGVRHRYPADKRLAAHDIESYIGLPLFDSRQMPTGLVFAMFREQVDEPAFTESVIRIFAARIGGEVERMKVESHIKQMAYYDGLTGLPNRELLLDRLNQALALSRRNGTQLVVMLLDLDHFKAINDSLGHPLGDQLLVEVGRRLRGKVRGEDTVARLGGDEFVVLLTNIPRESTLQQATRVADALRGELSDSYQIGGHELVISYSKGIALYPEDGDSAELLIKHADTAMYQAKARGRDQYQFFSPAMNTAVMERLKIENGLRQALQMDRFSLVFQPKVAIANNAFIGAEVLLRWHDPDYGLIHPDQFIPIADDTGLIFAIGAWVLEEACMQTARFICDGVDKHALSSISINVSPRQFRQPGFVEMVDASISRHGLSASCLELELTENVLIHDFEEVRHKLAELNEIGVKLSIDDFGTGYSSLRYLKDLPIDIIKIDRSFIRNVTSQHSDAAIVETILSMSQHLGMFSVAEGVETEQQLDFLRRHGCDAYQGYLFSKPLPANEFAELQASYRMQKPDNVKSSQSGSET
jgi:diguanylate cyclase (GGDEF)-like protein